LGYLEIEVDRAAAENDGTAEAVAGAASSLSCAALSRESKNADWGAGKTSGYASRDKNAEPCFILSCAASSRLEGVAALDGTTIARVVDRSGVGESGDEDGHGGSVFILNYIEGQIYILEFQTEYIWDQ